MNRKRHFLWFAACLPLIVAASPAAAYVGPGAGLSLLGALWGVLVAVGAAIAFVVLWPFRRLLRKRRPAGGARSPDDDVGKKAASDSPKPSQDEASHHGAA